MTQARFLNHLAFAVLLAATLLGAQSPWALLFFYWTFLNVTSGRAFLLSDVSRQDDPILFWLIQIVWVVFGAALIAQDFSSLPV